MKKWIKRVLLGGTVSFALFAVVMIGLAWTAFGKGASGQRLETMKKSKQWSGSGFENPQPLWNDVWGSVKAMNERSPVSSPKKPLPVVKTDVKTLKTLPKNGLRITWLGHSTTLIELDGMRILTDPVWGERASPFTFVGPQRWYEMPISLEDLPPIDVVVISHDHYDHLDYPTFARIKDTWKSTKFLVPLGVGAHLEYWGVPAAQIVEMDWWQEKAFGDVTITCTPARHASGRQVFDQNDTLWAGYAFVGPKHRVYFSGDTGLFPAFKDIGDKYGPFDVTMIEVGAYHRAWPDWHIGPEQAIQAHRMLKGKLFLPIHWGMFDLAMHGWTEPIERVQVAANAANVPVITPRPGEIIDPKTTKTTKWWPEVPWDDAKKHPIKSTKVDAEKLLKQ